MPSGRPSIGSEFHARIETVLKEHPELGYQNTSELIKELLRQWLAQHEGVTPRHGNGTTPMVRAVSSARPTHRSPHPAP